MAEPNQAERAVPLVQTLVLAVLLAAPGLFAIRAANIQDPDIWWHLRSGQWIVEHHAVPYTDPFSSTAAGAPWAAYSWLFELLLYRVYTAFHLTGLIGYAATLVVLITAAAHRMLRRLQADFSICVGLTYAAVFSLGHLYTPRPWLFTILLFVFELDLILTARRTGRPRPLLWLPLLFALWANLHIQFIDGLIVLGLAMADALFRAWRKPAGAGPPIAPRWWAGLFAGCLAAVCINPYGWHIYTIAYDLAAQPGVLNKISELASIPFRALVDWVTLALALAAAAALARSSRLRWFELALFAFAVYTGFRSQRDVWLTSLVCAAILAETIRGSKDAADRTPAYGFPLALAVALAVLAAGFPLLQITELKLAADLDKAMPVRAVAYAQDHHLPGPLWNDFNWGGYLIWNLRLPVSIDGRAALHGDERIDRSNNTLNGAPGWAADPTLSQARLVIVSVKTPLAQLLRFDPRFTLAYSDETAAVFIAPPGR